MPYPRNTQRWITGDLVIHAADAKKPEMLLRVQGYSPQGLVVTRYVHPHHLPGMNRRMEFPLEDLLDPKQFNIVVYPWREK